MTNYEKNMLIDHIDRYRLYLIGERKSPNTIKLYVEMMRNFLYFVKKDPMTVNDRDINEYKVYLAVDKKYSKNSIYTAMKAIQSFYKFMNLDVAQHIQVPRRSKKLPTYLNEFETTQLLNQARSNVRDYAILLILAYTGLRVNELCNLKISNIDFSEKIIRVQNGKGDKDRIVVIEEKTITALKEYLKVRKPVGEWLFTSQKYNRISTVQVERIVRKYAKQCGIAKKVTPHVLRHTLATTLLRNGADIRFIQQILGHASLATTQIYTHINDSVLKNMYEKTKPSY